MSRLNSLLLSEYIVASMRLYHEIPASGISLDEKTLQKVRETGIGAGYLINRLNVPTHTNHLDSVLASYVAGVRSAFHEIRGAGYSYIVLDRDWLTTNMISLATGGNISAMSFFSFLNDLSCGFSTSGLSAGEKILSKNGRDFEFVVLRDKMESRQIVQERVLALAGRWSSLSSDEITYMLGAIKYENVSFSEIEGQAVFGEIFAVLRAENILVRPSSVNDILKLATYISGSNDLSLSKGVTVALNKPARRQCLSALEDYILEAQPNGLEAVLSFKADGNARLTKMFSDMRQKYNFWSVFSQRVNGTSKETLKKYPNASLALSFIRQNKKAIVTNGSVIDREMRKLYVNDYSTFQDFLSWLSSKEGAGLFARNLDWLLRTVSGKAQMDVLHEFSMATSYLSPMRLLRLAKFMKGRIEQNAVGVAGRTFFLKGENNKTKKVKDRRPNLENAQDIANRIEDMAKRRMAGIFQNNGKSVWIDQKFHDILLPINRRGSAKSFVEGYDFVTMGSIVRFDASEVLRLFTWWIGNDVDLAINAYTAIGEHKETVDFRSPVKSFARHSGDVRHAPAPDGGAEFIDVDIEAARREGIRYITMNLTMYSSGKFSGIPCFAGLSNLTHKEASHTDFDINKVKMKIDVESHATQGCPIIIDIQDNLLYICDVFNGQSNGCVSNSNGFELDVIKAQRMASPSFAEAILMGGGTETRHKAMADVVYEYSGDTASKLLQLLDGK